MLRDYADLYDVGPGWTFLSGDPDDITELRHRLGAFDPDPIVDLDKSQHAAVVIYGDEVKGRWCAFPGLLPPESLAFAIQRVMAL